MIQVLLVFIVLCLIVIAWLWMDVAEEKRRGECWQREARGWEETADRARGFAQDAIDALAARHADIDERDAEIDRLRQVRSEYIQHLVATAPRSVRELRRETWRN